MMQYTDPGSSSLPLVTVIVPTIGRPKYIVDTLRSVLAQDWPRLDVLVSDNAPSVSTAKLLDEHGVEDARLRFIRHERRLGFSEHMNVCLEQARGDYVMILSDDDQLTSGYVSEMCRMLSADSAVKVCIGRQIKFGPDDAGLLPVSAPRSPAQVLDGKTFLKGIFSGQLATGILTYVSMFARRDDMLVLGGFKGYPDGSHADNFLLLSLALRGKVALGSEQMLYRIYVTSFGLSTPFSALLEATRAYMVDAANAAQSAPSISHRDAATLVQLLKRGNVRMLLDRLRHVYRPRVATSALVRFVFQTLRFAITPVRWL